MVSSMFIPVPPGVCKRAPSDQTLFGGCQSFSRAQQSNHSSNLKYIEHHTHAFKKKWQLNIECKRENLGHGFRINDTRPHTLFTYSLHNTRHI